MDEEIRKDEETPEEENKNGISADLIRGHINTIILRTLYERDKYGYEIMTEIEERSHGQYTLKQPTLYSALKRLESQGYINAYWKTDEVSNGGRRKYFTLTDSGREITEKNQSEWEYSRTVIDSLISDRNFDFTQPAPSAVDFKILKSSTSRVPLVKSEETEKDSTAEKPNEQPQVEVTQQVVQEQVIQEQPVQQIEQQPQAEVTQQVVQEQVIQEQPVQQIEQQPQAEVTQQVVQEQVVQEQPVQQIEQQPQAEVTQQVVQEQVIQEQPVQQIEQQPQAEVTQQVVQEQVVQEQPVRQTAYSPTAEQIAEERAARHENYLKLISQPAEQGDRAATNPSSERIDTEKLIYNIKPETERDYKNLIDNIYLKTLRQQPASEIRQQPAEQKPARQESERREIPVQINYEKSERQDNYAQISEGSDVKKKYTRGSAMLKSSLIIAVVMLVEFALVLAFKTNLNVALSYPIVILTLAVAQLMIFGILSTTNYGKNRRKPANTSYITTTIVLAIISVLIIFVTSLLLEVRFSEISEVLAKIIIPSVIALNMPAFSCLFYIFSK